MSPEISLPPRDERRQLRLRAGLSAAALAQKVGVSAASISNWETDRDPSSPMDRGRYAAALVGLARRQPQGPGRPEQASNKKAPSGTPTKKGPRLPDPDRRVAAREAAEVSLDQLAAVLPVDSATVKAWETGEADP
jgi:DNA-binding transcriptional regulator YiaG